MTKKALKHLGFNFLLVLLSALFLLKCSDSSEAPLVQLKKDAHIALIGNNLCSRMMNYGHFETELHLRFPDSLLFVRNMCDGGNTPGFRPHSGRNHPWAFPGAEQFHAELANPSGSKGHLESEDEWLSRLKTDIILAFFGYNESFAGTEGLENYKAELDAFIKHTLKQKYNGHSTPQLVIISPIAFQDLSYMHDLPDGKMENRLLKIYSSAMREIAQKNNVPFLDVFSQTKKWYVL